MDDFTYLDFIGADESILFPAIGILFSPVLFPLYLVLKALTAFIDYLCDVFAKSESREKRTIVKEEATSEVTSISKSEELARTISRLKAEKSRLEEDIKRKEQQYNVIQFENETVAVQSEREMSLRYKPGQTKQNNE